jgi:hypothetical protein
MEIKRNRESRTILITMMKKIQELEEKYPEAIQKKRLEPMPVSGYIVREKDYEELSERKNRLLTTKETETCMSIVGCLLWIQNVRLDIIFAVLYYWLFINIQRYVINIRWR